MNFTLPRQTIFPTPFSQSPLSINRIRGRWRSPGIFNLGWGLVNRFPHLRQRKSQRDGALANLISGRRLLVMIQPSAFDLTAGLENEDISAGLRKYKKGYCQGQRNV